MKERKQYTEEELVALLRTKSQVGFRYLYEHYSGALFGQVRSIINDRLVAGDVLREVFVKIWNNIDSYDSGKSRLFTWMLQITRSVSIDMTRSEGSENHIRSAGAVQDKFQDTGLRKTIQSLKTEQKELVELSYFQGYTQEEISVLLNIPLGTVKTRLRAALVVLRQKVIIESEY